jgi:hypothetical protein
VPPVDGGIALKIGQKLIGADVLAMGAGPSDPAPRITNSNGQQNGGNAVVLADRNEVANLFIVNPWKSGIQGIDVTSAYVHNNQVTGANQSCTEGFRVFAFSVIVGSQTITIPGISAGWGAIEFDFRSLADPGALIVNGNFIHDAACANGINLQLNGRTSVTANVSGNVFKFLKQAAFGVEPDNTVLGIGTQTADNSTLTLNARYNFMDNLGNVVMPSLPDVGNADGMLINLGGFSHQIVNLDHHTYQNTRGFPGLSSNGFEVALMENGGARADVLIQNSAFSGSPSDILQFNFLGSNGIINATVDHTIIKDSTGTGYIPILAVGNNGTCLEAFNAGLNSSLSLNVIGSTLTNCVAQGIGVFNQLAAPTIEVDVEGSSLTGNKYSNLIFDATAPVDDLTIKVENSNLTNSPGRGFEFDQAPGLTSSSAIDLGGGGLGSVGNNSILRNGLDAVITNYDVSVKNDWWGSANGPSPSSIDLIGTATLDVIPFLTQPPH